MEYQILKISYKDFKERKIKSLYVIFYKEINIWKSILHFKKIVDYKREPHSTNIKFKTEIGVKSYLEFLKQETPKDEVIL